jgi:hypothetical protein
MNLVFGSILLFILISPGLIFRFSYLQGTYAKLSFKVSAIEEIFWALIPACFLQSLAILFIQNVLHYTIRLDIVYRLITGSSSDTSDFFIIQNNIGSFLVYLTALIIISAILGIACREVVRKYRLDIHNKFLRFGNEWHYLFSGEILYSSKNLDPDSISLIQIDVVMQSSEGNLIYSGILEDFYLSRDNGLDRIYLRNVYRRKLKDDLDPNEPNVGFLDRHLDARYYAMPGDFFVVTYDKIINLNISYYVKMDKTDATDEQNPE